MGKIQMPNLYYPSCYALVSGGKDSLTTAQVLADADRLLGCIALDTGINTPDWADFIRDTCAARNWPIEFYRTTANYEDLVRKYGFPGPARHQWFMSYLKGRAIRSVRREHPDAVLASGTRKAESNRRWINTHPISMWEGLPILTPIYDWTTDEVWDLFNRHGFKKSPAYQYLMVSGDCLCGAFAVPGEAAALRLGYPAVADHFDALGHSIRTAHPTRCTWGWGCNRPRRLKTPREASLCQECLDLMPNS
jgi:3'-phosphoadenosine 5'-phosphosulfate sulfotransferase (PAPS reductase)/FAD synthetase